MLPAALLPLLKPHAYPHRCDAIELFETHISWVLLTGEFAYKIKKPVDFGFLDFSTLAKRLYYCEEEIRLNRRFAPDLYLNVVAITRTDSGVCVDAAGDVVEYAVRMRQFQTTQQLDRRLDADQLEAEALATFGATLADVHRALPRCDVASSFGTPAAVLQPVRENFAQIATSRFATLRADSVAQLARWSEAQHTALRDRFAQRRAEGFVRECHGDLHLSNLVALDEGVRAFDCIEFSESLRWIDVISDVAFLVMDCAMRRRDDLAYAFLDRYLETTGDYAGCDLLRFYLVYRSMVRAKVAALQATDTADARLRQRFEDHVEFACARALQSRGVMILMCGLSGSGKSWLAQRLLPAVAAVRIRSDVERKRLAGLAAMARSGSAVGSGLYGREQTEAVYRRLAASADALLSGGERVIVDATFLDQSRRQVFCDHARSHGVACVIVHCIAPLPVLQARIHRRDEARADASEATVEVLQAQRSQYQPPTATEATVLTVDTTAAIDFDSIARQIVTIERHGSGR